MQRGIAAVKRFALPLFAVIGAAKCTSKYIYQKTDQAYLKKNKESIKFHGYYNTLVSWMGLLQNNITVAEYFSENSKIAVYGMGKIGELICHELMENGIQVSYGIDGNASGENIATGLHVYSMDNNKLPEVDVVIVSISHLSDGIIPELEIKTSAKIITLDEILDSLWKGRA